MHFSQQGVYYHVSIITGPRHNLLAVAFSDDDGIVSPICEMLAPIGEHRQKELDASAIRSAVLEGVAEGNQRFRTNYRVARIQYVENDSPPETTYRYLALKLIEHLASQAN